MKISTAPRAMSLIIEDEDGVDVVCEALPNDRKLLQLIDGAADVLVIAPQSAGLSSAEERLVETLEAYRTGAQKPRSYWDDVEGGEDHDRRLSPIRDVLEEHGRWLVAGRAERPGPHGIESIAVVALIGQPHAACVVRVRLEADASARAA